MAIAARLPFAARRNELRVWTMRFVGMDLTGKDMRMQVRRAPDMPGSPLINLETVTTSSAEGLKLEGVTTEGGIPISTVTGRINKSTMEDAEKLPYSGEVGSDTRLAYGLQIGGTTLIVGEFWALASPIDSDEAPIDRPLGMASSSVAPPPWSSTSLNFSADEVVQVTIDGAAALGPIVAQAEAVAAAVAAAANQYRRLPAAPGGGLVLLYEDETLITDIDGPQVNAGEFDALSGRVSAFEGALRIVQGSPGMVFMYEDETLAVDLSADDLAALVAGGGSISGSSTSVQRDGILATAAARLSAYPAAVAFGLTGDVLHLSAGGQSNVIASYSGGVLRATARLFGKMLPGGTRPEDDRQASGGPRDAPVPATEALVGVNGETFAGGFFDRWRQRQLQSRALELDQASIPFPIVTIEGIGATPIEGLGVSNSAGNPVLNAGATTVLDQVADIEAVAGYAAAQDLTYQHVGTMWIGNESQYSTSPTYFHGQDWGDGRELVVDYLQGEAVSSGSVQTAAICWAPQTQTIGGRTVNGATTVLAGSGNDFPHIALEQFRRAMEEPAKNVLVCPTHMLPHETAGVHYMGYGQGVIGAYLYDAAETLASGLHPYPLHFGAIARDGQYLAVEVIDVHGYPIVLDPAMFPTLSNFGLRVLDGAGTAVVGLHATRPVVVRNGTHLMFRKASGSWSAGTVEAGMFGETIYLRNAVRTTRGLDHVFESPGGNWPMHSHLPTQRKAFT